jgi:hypothetical protein
MAKPRINCDAFTKMSPATPRPCGRPAKVIVDGMCYCNRHNPNRKIVRKGEKRVSMPTCLTAENGSKYAFLGEFHESIEDIDGNVRKVAVSWTTIKEIYAKAVRLHGEKI